MQSITLADFKKYIWSFGFVFNILEKSSGFIILVKTLLIRTYIPIRPSNTVKFKLVYVITKNQIKLFEQVT